MSLRERFLLECAIDALMAELGDEAWVEYPHLDVEAHARARLAHQQPVWCAFCGSWVLLPRAQVEALPHDDRRHEQIVDLHHPRPTKETT